MNKDNVIGSPSIKKARTIALTGTKLINWLALMGPIYLIPS
jgi:hypothetical protein